MVISEQNKIRILEWRLENWQDDPKVWKSAPPGIKVSEDDLRKFDTEMVIRHKPEGGDINIIKVSMDELERLKKLQ